MYRPGFKLILWLIFTCACSGMVQAQTTASTRTDKDESSEQTESSEEAYRRQMELEGRREQETFSNTSYSSQTEQEAIDKLPEASQKNIRDQITDIIIEGDQWQPSDVLEDYPYVPTAAAEKDSALLEQEQEAWEEQVDKYHEREAAAFGAVRPPAPGSEQQQAGTGKQGNGTEQGEGAGTAGQNGGQSEEDGSGAAGGYQPYQPGSRQEGDETSTAGVSESALDFLRGKQGRSPSGTGGNAEKGEAPSLVDGQQAEGEKPEPAGAAEPPEAQTPALADGGEKPTEEAAQQAASQQRAPDGSLPIEQLDQLQGIAGQSATGQPESAPTASVNQAQQQDSAQTTAEADRTPAEETSQQEPVAEAVEAEEQSQSPESPAEAEPEQVAEASERSEAESESQEQKSTVELDLSSPGIIAIRDLGKLEGVKPQEIVEPEDENP